MTVKGYARISSIGGEDSIQTQKDIISSYCKTYSLELDEVVSDNNVSGGIPISERPEGSRLFERDVSAIVTVRLDRMFRNVRDMLATIDIIEKKKIPLHIINMQGISINSQTANGRFMLTVFGAIDEMYRFKAKEDTSRALQSKKSSMTAYTREVFGFKKLHGRMVVDDREMEVIREIFDKQAQGQSMYKIVNELNEQGIKTKTGKQFTRSTIRYILNNTIYQSYVKKSAR